MSEAVVDAQPRGFAGLALLASSLPPAPVPIPIAPKVEAQARERGTPAPNAMPGRPSTPFWTSGRRWTAVTAVTAGGLIACGILSDRNARRAPVSSVQADRSDVAFPSAAPKYVAQPLATPRYDRYTAADDGSEAEPSGTPGQILSAPEIRYCLSENIRIDALRAAGDSGSPQFIERFNTRVSSYNVRCASYRYRVQVMNRIKAEVDLNSSKIRQDAVTLDRLSVEVINRGPR